MSMFRTPYISSRAATVIVALLLTAFFVTTLNPILVSAQDVTGGLTQTQYDNTQAASTTPAGGIKECTVFSFPGTFNLDCLWFKALSWFGSWFLTIGGALLRLVGALFDSLITNVIVSFKTSLDALGITTAIDSGWTVFRDFSNILIIGIFVFIAISIILGLQEFGQKKLIAKVLIIAVLINFSLLFTKIIIDSSNFVAYQIYSQVSGVSGSVQDPNKDIAQAFLSPMGITSIWDTQDITKAAGATADTPLKAGLQAFFFGLVGGILLIAVAAVLLYGCFLIMARAILFIFLMITAALAFATYLVPKFSEGEYGWSAWWKSLINNAIFAPLLMLFLVVSLSIVSAAGAHSLVSCTGTVGQQTCTSDLGKIIADPATQLQTNAGWSAIIIYIIGIGLLFVSFRMASKFAGTISGFNLAAAVPAFGLAAGARIAGLAGRTFIGRPALRASTSLQEAAKNKEKYSMFTRQLFDFGAQGLKSVAKRDFNAMRTPLGAGLAGSIGIKQDTLAGAKIGGAYANAEKRAEKIAEQAQRMTRTAGQQAQTEGAAIAEAIKTSPALANVHEQARTVHANATEDEKAARQEFARINERHNEQITRLQSEVEDARRSGGDVDAANQRLARARADQSQVMDEQTERIRQAHQAVEHAASYVGKVEDQARTIAETTGKLQGPVDSATLARELAHKKFTSSFFTEKENEHIANLASHEAHKLGSKKKMKDTGLFDALKDFGGSGEASRAPTTPVTPPAGDHGDHGGGH